MADGFRISLRRLGLLALALAPVLALDEGSCTRPNLTVALAPGDKQHVETAYLVGGPPPDEETQTCDATAGPACAGFGTPEEHTTSGEHEGVSYQARVSTVDRQIPGVVGFVTEWYFASDGPVPISADANIVYRSFVFPDASGAGELELYSVQAEWGPDDSMDLVCNAEARVSGQPPVAIPTDGTVVHAPYEGDPFVALPVDIETDCDAEPCTLEAESQCAASLAVEMRGVREDDFPYCTGDSHCPGDTPFCVEGFCRSGLEGSPCSNARDCEAGHVCGPSVCQDGSPGDNCEVSADCPNSLACVGLQCQAGLEGDPCEDHAGCAPEAPFCAHLFGPDFDGFCSTGGPGSSCSEEDECQPALACVGGVPGQCLETG